MSYIYIYLLLTIEKHTSEGENVGIYLLRIFLFYIQSADYFFMCLGDFNGHMGRNINRFNGAHEGYGVGQRNLEG